MSQNSTNKKTPQLDMMKLDGSSSISDSSAVNSKQLLNAYVYDFLIKNKLSQTAKIFINEAELPVIKHDKSNKNSPLISNPSTPKDNLPNLSMVMDTPQSFLFEWWQIFWDVFQAKNNVNNTNKNSQFALQYYQLQVMKQRQQQEIQGLNVQPNFLNAKPNPSQPPISQNQFAPPNAQNQFPPQLTPQQISQLDPQQQQRFMMQMMAAKQQQQQLQQQIQQQQVQQQQVQQVQHQQQPQQLQQQQVVQSQVQPQVQQVQQVPQPQQVPQQPQVQNNDQIQPPIPQPPQQMNGNLPLGPQQQQQLFMNQQQQQPQNRIQQHAQTQMHNLRQQAVAAQQIQFNPQNGQRPIPNNMPNNPNNPNAMPNAMPNQGPNNVPNGMQSFNPQDKNPSFQQQQQQQQPPPPPPGMRMNNNMNKANGAPNQLNRGGHQSPILVNANGNGNNNNMPPNRNLNALQDYQMQLMLLEKQNKKRLDIARNNGNENGQQQPTMLPPQSNQPTTNTTNSNHNTPALPPKPSPAPSPIIGNKPSPSGSNGGKRKKDAPAKRGRKPSATNTNSSSNSTHTTPITAPAPAPNTLLKKEYNVPLTPASEIDNSASKRKRKLTGNESPKKQLLTKHPSATNLNNLPANNNNNNNGPKKKKSIKDNKIKKEEDIVDKATTGSGSIDKNSTNIKINENSPSMSNQINLHSSLHPDQISTEILTSTSNNDQAFFGSGTNGSLDDIDFDFNSFLEGTAGDTGMGDSISGFNWGNVDAIEGGE